MKERIIRFAVIILMMYLIANIVIKVDAKDKPEEFRQIRVTFYTDQGITKDGSYTREGICAMNDYYLGATVILYKIEPDGSVGDMVGIYEVKDTGGNTELKSGNRVDIWMPSLDEGWELMKDINDRCYMQILWDCVG